MAEVTLTHIYLREIGGIVPGEENSGRTILVPNSVLFEQNITNYTLENEYVMDEVNVPITYNSDLDEAIRIGLDSARKVTADFMVVTHQEPYARTWFTLNGIDLHIRYFAPATRLQLISSSVTQEIYRRIRANKRVFFGHQHMDVLLNRRQQGGYQYDLREGQQGRASMES